MAKKKHLFAPTMFVYVFDYDNGKPLFGVTEHLEDIEEDGDVAVYGLVRVGKKTTKVNFE